MDPDDYVDHTLLAQVYASIGKNPAQVVLFGHIEEYYDKKGHLQYTHPICPEEHYYRSAEEFRPHIIELEQQTLYGYAWNKFYLLSYIRELKLDYVSSLLCYDHVFSMRESSRTACPAAFLENSA